MRRAVWDGIAASAELGAIIKQTYRWDDDGATLGMEPFIPALGDCPAVSIYPMGAGSPWVLNQAQGITYQLQAKFWTPEWSVVHGERLWQYFQRAFWQITMVDAVAAGQLHPQSSMSTAASWRRVASPMSDGNVDEHDLTEVSWQYQLAMHWNPRTDTGSLTLD